MKISVITVCFNSAKTIGQTLRSVREQTHEKIEHIIIDGASRDNTLDIVAAEGRHVIKLVSEPDDGIYSAMNKGCVLASGEVIGFLNSDDAYANSTVLELVARNMEDGTLDALFGDAEFFLDMGAGKALRRYKSNRFRPERIGWGWMPAHPTLFLRRRVFDEFGPFREDYKIAGDFEYVARIFGRNTLTYRYLPEVLVRMRIGGVSTGGWRNTLQLNREVLRACRDNDIPSNIVKLLSKYPMKIAEYFPK